MNELKPKKKKITLSAVIRYIFGLFFLLVGIVSLFDGNSEILPGIFSILIGIVSTPAIADPLESKLNVSPSAPLRVIIVFCLFMAIGATADPVEQTTDSNQEFVSAPVTSDNGTTTLSVPASTETSELTTTPEAVTTSDNIGILNIITNPTGAIVTVDGVSQGLSPVNDLSVDEGNHVIDLYLSGYNPKTLTVYVMSSDTKTIDWTFTPYVDSSPTETKTSEVTPTETPEVTPTETPKSEPAETQVTTSDSESVSTTNTGSNTIDTNSELLYASSESDVYHASWCSYVERIKPENLITFDSVQAAEKAGYRACKKCGG
ncbi:hypothetical protein SDC9_76084 [bioreactor metagenome]|uniref:PEGA domain-containing protein n=1 Tax=bioreactor metagenome TaxID=1076179 RepID=A0A644YU37_9ZZZZ